METILTKNIEDRALTMQKATSAITLSLIFKIQQLDLQTDLILALTIVKVDRLMCRKAMLLTNNRIAKDLLMGFLKAPILVVMLRLTNL